MLKSISNIAWEHKDEEWVISKLRESGWDAIEVAPSRIWKDFRAVSMQQREDYRKSIGAQGLKICSLHSLFWGIEGVKLFGEEIEQENLRKYLKELVDLAVDLQSRVLIFGSPSVRDRGIYEYKKAIDIAAEVLRPAAKYAQENNVKILIEPLTKKESNFINTHQEAMELIEAIGNEGFGLHLDVKSIAEEETEIDKIIFNCKEKIEHFHVNDPGLVGVGTIADYHFDASRALKEIHYSHYVSIEMRCVANARENIRKSIEYVNRMY